MFQQPKKTKTEARETVNNEDRNSREEAPLSERAQRPSPPSSPPVRPGGQADQCSHRLWSRCPLPVLSLGPWLHGESAALVPPDRTAPGRVISTGAPSWPLWEIIPGILRYLELWGPYQLVSAGLPSTGWRVGPVWPFPRRIEGCHCPSGRPPAAEEGSLHWGPRLPAGKGTGGPHLTPRCHSSSSFFPVPYTRPRVRGTPLPSTHIPTQPHCVALALSSPMARVQVPAPPHTGGCTRQVS